MTEQDIANRLGVTFEQIKWAVYSGALPPPNSFGVWDDQYIEFFVNNWAARIERSKPKLDNKNIVIGNCTFPRHQR